MYKMIYTILLKWLMRVEDAKFLTKLKSPLNFQGLIRTFALANEKQ